MDWITRQNICRTKQDIFCKKRKAKKNLGLTYHTSLYISQPCIDKAPIIGNVTDIAWYQLYLPSKGTIDVEISANEQVALYKRDGFSQSATLVGLNFGAWPSARVSRHGLESGLYVVMVGQYGFDTPESTEDFSDVRRFKQYLIPEGWTITAKTIVYPQPPVPTPVPKFGLYNTGQGLFIGHTNTPGTPDPNYFYDVVSHGVPRQAQVVQKPDYYRTGENNNESADIKPEGPDPQNGNFLVRTSFDLTGYDLNTVSLSLEIALWHTLTSVFVNGTVELLYSDGVDQGISITPHVNSWERIVEWVPITISTGFQDGINTLAFNCEVSSFRLRVVSASGDLL